MDALSTAWVNNALMKCDVVLLKTDADGSGVTEELVPRPGIEDAVYVPGAVIWRVDRQDATRSRIVGTPLCSRVTVRSSTRCENSSTC